MKRKFNITAGAFRSGNLSTLLAEAGQPSNLCPVTVEFGEDPVKVASIKAAEMDEAAKEPEPEEKPKRRKSRE